MAPCILNLFAWRLRLPRGIIDRRIMVLILGFGGLFSALTIRLFYIQIIQNERLSALALKQQERTIEVQPARGAIYDRQGRPLALNVQSQSFFAVPAEVTEPAVTAQKLSRLVGLAPSGLEKRLRSGKGFVWIRRKVSDATAQAIQALDLDGIHSLTESKRVYPEANLASHVLGFVGLDNQGLSGMELQYDHAIRGQSGWVRVTQDAKGRRIATSTRIYKQPVSGQDIVLTIDKVVQHMAERELERGLASSQARAGSVIVMDPRTGEILALASKPDFDPNHFSRYPLSSRRNRAINDVYEPGSTFKLVTASAALEENLFHENETVDCENGQAAFSGLVVRDHEPHGRLSFRDVIAYSSNIGTVKIGLRLGMDRMIHYVREFGFGQPTGIELPGEASGLLKPFNQWQRWNMISIPFGQGLAVTPLQMAVAYAAVANDGLLPRPTLVRECRNPEQPGSQANKPEMRRRVISPETARRMRDILVSVVAKGTGTEAAIPNYRVAGKTGTAQKPTSTGGYDPRYHVASFMGFFPADKPEVLITVVIDAPGGVQWGGQIAGPIFREIGRQLTAYLGISPDVPQTETIAASPDNGRINPRTVLVAVPAVSGRSQDNAKQQLAALGLTAACLGEGDFVEDQLPQPGRQINVDSRVVLYCRHELSGPSQPAALVNKAAAANAAAYRPVVMPNVAGLSLRNAIQILSAYGLRARVSGSGIVSLQTPGPNAQAQTGQICSLQCQDPEVCKR
jgi:penicillin-binding protein 2